MGIGDYLKVHTCCIVKSGAMLELGFKPLSFKCRADWPKNDPPVDLIVNTDVAAWATGGERFSYRLESLGP